MQTATEPIESTERPMMRSIETDGPYSELKDKLMLFGQFAGDWQYESQYFLPDGSTATAKGEIHFGWILGGTAIQDVMTGVVLNPPPGFPRTGFGTMVRFFDPNIDAWHCVWVAPLSRLVQTFTARIVGDEIVLEGKNAAGFLERWIFSEVTPDSFHWRAVESRDQGQTWHLDQRIWAVRIRPER